MSLNELVLDWLFVIKKNLCDFMYIYISGNSLKMKYLE